MKKVIELRKAIIADLTTVHPRVYYQKPDKDALYPYLVYDLPNSTDDGSLERFILDVDGWDINDDSTFIENLMDSVDRSLHRKTIVINNQLSVSFYRDNRLSLIDENPEIRRRKYIYQVRTFERRG